MRSADEIIFQRDGFRCQYCGFDGSSFESWAFLQVDHFKPRSKGGLDEDENLVTACIICNQMKKDYEFATIEDAGKSLRSWWSQMHTFWETKVNPLVRRG